ncbi:DrmB family protein [Labrys okinawensis]|uniref:DrmB family protein n=1 Tax=Labrys okinawensis TaxID=346911 RepID=UPI0039BD66BA
MPDTTQSFSQLLLTYGPGAMLDLPDHAVVVSGLQGWHHGGQWQPIEEQRLVPLLRQQLAFGPEFEGLRPPPEHDDDRHDDRRPGVDVMVFPTWFTVEDVPAATGQAPATSETRRRMVEFEHLQTRGDRLSYVDSANGKRLGVNPIRFVGACAKGHLEDIDWRGLVHRGGDRSCRKPMFWVERGVSSDPSDISVQCNCGSRVTMADLYKPKFLGTCSALSPWLMPRYVAGESCIEDLRLLSRSATNTYFAQTVTVISLTRTDDRVRQTIDEHRQTVESLRSLPNFIQVLRSLPQTKEPFAPFSDQEIASALATMAEGGDSPSTNPRIAEFDALASGAPTIGYDDAGAFLFAETLDRTSLTLSAPWDGFIGNIVKVSRLREVTCLYGFTRLEPPPTPAESELDEIRLKVDGAPLDRQVKWLPAIEQFGEGIFLHVNPDFIRNWRDRADVVDHASELHRSEAQEAAHFNRPPRHLGVAYWALHSLSHALMAELALECGYPISSLKERIYASGAGQPERFGILIYTSTAGAQGTLGGLSGMAERLPEILAKAVQGLELCSNDPICADHHAGTDLDERPLHGAACHACILVPETSCEARNTRLDRGLLVSTLVGSKSAMFF